MKNNKLTQGIIILLLFVASTNGFSATNVAGMIVEDTTWSSTGSPYTILQSVIINQGATLTIEPGVLIKFNKQAGQTNNEKLNIIINGKLIAKGTVESPIIFTSASSSPLPGDWDYIEFTATAIGASYGNEGEYVDGSILQYVTVEYGGGETDFPTIYANGTAPYLNSVTIQNNSDTGIKYDNIGTEVLIDNSSFISNSASSGDGFGGAIYSDETSITINNSYFEKNSALSGYDYGGAIYSQTTPYSNSSPKHLTIYNSTFNNNFATSHGGAIYATTPLTINSSTFENNSVFDNASINYGGAIFSGALTVNNSTFSNNSAIDAGGAIYSYATPLTINNSVFTSNYNIYHGGAIYSRTAMTVTNSTFKTNFSYNNDSIIYSETSINLTGTLLEENYGGSTLYAQQSATINNSTIINTQAAPSLDGFTPASSESFGLYVPNELTISNSNIYENGSYDIKNNSASNVQAINNYWGTADEAIIYLNIYDVYENPRMGEVIFSPFLTSLAANAPSPTALAEVSDPSQSYELVQKAYLAYYGRPGDPSGLDYWAARLNASGGNWTTEILESFGNSEEFQAEFGGLEPAELITNIYIQLFNRSPEQAGLDYFIGLLDTQQSSLSQIAVEILNAATGNDATTVANKLLVCNYYTDKVANGMSYGSTQTIKSIVSVISSDPTVVDNAYALIDSMAGQ